MAKYSREQLLERVRALVAKAYDRSVTPIERKAFELGALRIVENHGLTPKELETVGLARVQAEAAPGGDGPKVAPRPPRPRQPVRRQRPAPRQGVRVNIIVTGSDWASEALRDLQAAMAGWQANDEYPNSDITGASTDSSSENVSWR